MILRFKDVTLHIVPPQNGWVAVNVYTPGKAGSCVVSFWLNGREVVRLIRALLSVLVLRKEVPL